MGEALFIFLITYAKIQKIWEICKYFPDYFRVIFDYFVRYFYGLSLPDRAWSEGHERYSVSVFQQIFCYQYLKILFIFIYI